MIKLDERLGAPLTQAFVIFKGEITSPTPFSTAELCLNQGPYPGAHLSPRDIFRREEPC